MSVAVHRPRTVSLSAIVVALALLVGAAACTKAKKTPPEQVAAQSFLSALGGGDATRAGQLTSDPTAATASIKASLTGLAAGGTGSTGTGTGTGAKGKLTVTGLTNRTSTTATAAYSASWTLPGVSSPFSYTGSVPVAKTDSGWTVTWNAADLHPQLTSGTHLVLQRVQPARGALLDSAGKPLFTETPVVRVGIEKALVKNLPSLAATLAAIPQLQTTAAEVTAAVTPAGAKDFVEIITLRRSVYEAIKAKVYSLDGTVFRDDTLLLGPSARFGQPLLGSVGEATKELIDASSGRLRAGDQTGLSGLQRSLDATLSGTAGDEVFAATDADDTRGVRIATVVAAKPGTPVTLALNRTLQSAADAALVGTTLPAAIVAVQPSTGKVLAVANSAAATDDIGLVGQYPAGSTFKIVTYAAAFTSKPALQPTTAAACPATVTVDGRSFENENKFSYTGITIRDAFAYSCNTTAISTALGLPATAMQQAATALGLGAKWDLGVDAFSGSLPTPASQTERAADAIGQGRVLVSPLLMASIAGAATSGRPVAPSLVLGRQATPGAALDASVIAKLNTLMRATVTEPAGTGNALSGLPGAVEGKTGTAEFGTDIPPRSHSWFAGSRGDLAFAVFVYGGESSHTAAVPLAKAFLTAAP